MNRTRLLTIALLALLVLNLGTLVFLWQAREKQPGQPPPGGNAADFIVHALKLDDQQQKQFAALRDQHQAVVRQAREQDRKLHDLYFDLLKADTPDRAKADSVAGLFAIERKRIDSATFEHFRQLRGLCRDEQKKLFDNVIDQVVHMLGPKEPPPGPERSDELR